VPFHSTFGRRAWRLPQIAPLSCALLCTLMGPAPAAAQQPPDTVARRQLDSLAAVVAGLTQQLDGLAAQQAQAAPARAPGAFMNISLVGLTTAGWSTEPDVESLQLGAHDPRVRGFGIPNAELALDGAVDPYFQARAFIVYGLDAEGETTVELEEMYFLTTSLPHNLQLKGGQSFVEFGRQNPQHPHSWGFADQPLVLNRMFGGEGLRSQGVRLGWLLPTSFYTEAMVGFYNASGETTASFRSEESPELHGGVPDDSPVGDAADFLWVPRVATSLDLSDTQTLLAGASAAFGPNNSGPDADTRIVGADVYWKWRPLAAERGFPFLSLQAEALWRRYEAGARAYALDPAATLPAETLRDRGYYAQLLWGIKPLFVAGIRGEAASGDPSAFDSELRGDRWRISPNLTWYPTEFSKLRVQYNYDDRAGIGTDHSLWLQAEILLGAHAAHQF
jgi:hypothetical protein